MEGCIAQAYAIKALCSFYLTNMFGLPYSEANKTTLGIVNVTEPVPALFTGVKSQCRTKIIA